MGLSDGYSQDASDRLDAGDLAAYEADGLDRKLLEVFPGRVVRKGLTSLMKRTANVPTFVLEYLLGSECSTDDEVALKEGLENIRNILTNNYVRPDERERIKSLIRELGSYTIVDKVSVTLNEYQDFYEAKFTYLDIDPFVMPDHYVRDNSKLLTGGVWCIARIEYRRLSDEYDFEDEAALKKTKSGARGPEDSPFRLISLVPIQMPNLDLEDFIAQRKRFTTEEWRRVLLRSAGYEPDALTKREQLHFLERMVPLIERNYNLCELGPRGTGKSHLYKEVSPYAILLSGGKTTTANLFGHMRGRNLSQLGLVVNWDCVTFDEVAGIHFNDANAVQVMKDYMESGSYTRGRDETRANASMVFEGNINDSVQNMLKTTHLFDPFPPEFNNDSAFFDRMHCYLPGWEVPKMRSDLLTSRYGLITDCLSEFMCEMRRRDYGYLIDEHFRLNSDFNTRDETGVRKTFSGLAKLLFPDKAMTREEAKELLDYAIEGRRRVKEQLKIMAGIEYIDVNLGYSEIDAPGSMKVVYVPEQSSDTLIPAGPVQAGYVFGIGRSTYGDVAVYRLENKAVRGEGKINYEGVGNMRQVRDSLAAAFEFFENNAHRVAAGLKVDWRDYLLYFNDLQAKGPSDEVSLAQFIGLCSAASGRPVRSAMVVPGILRLSGSMDELTNLEDILRVAKNAGAKSILLPLSCIQDLQNMPPELLGSVNPEFYPQGDAVAAAKKALDL